MGDPTFTENGIVEPAFLTGVVARRKGQAIYTFNKSGGILHSMSLCNYNIYRDTRTLKIEPERSHSQAYGPHTSTVGDPTALGRVQRIPPPSNPFRQP